MHQGDPPAHRGLRVEAGARIRRERAAQLASGAPCCREDVAGGPGS